MTKHIHIHLHRASAKARDAGFDEAKHKRDHGKFSSTGGSGADPKEAHRLATNKAAGVPADTGIGRENRQKHVAARAYHEGQAKTHPNKFLRGAHAEAADMHKEALAAGHGSRESAAAHEMSESLAKQTPQANSSGVPVKHQPSGTTVPHAKAHLKPGGEVFTTHRNTPFKATYIGPDHGAGPNHHEIKVGNSRVSVPEHDLHPTREAAHKYNGG